MRNTITIIALIIMIIALIILIAVIISMHNEKNENIKKQNKEQLEKTMQQLISENIKYEESEIHNAYFKLMENIQHKGLHAHILKEYIKKRKRIKRKVERNNKKILEIKKIIDENKKTKDG